MNSEAIRILLVDDHQMLRDGVRRMLGEHPGLSVVGDASNGAAALAQVRATRPHVVVMDVHLPGENGIEISQRLLREFPEVKVVVLTGENQLVTVRQALQAGVAAFLTKEGSTDQLVRAIREVMDGRVYLSPDIASLVVQDYMSEVVGKPGVSKPVLTERDRLLLKLVAEGKRNKEIADVLGVEVKSVETYRSRLMRKLNCSSPADLTRFAIREGIATA